MAIKKSQGNAKDFFLQLLCTITLFVGIVNLINLWFQYISIWFPDPLNSYYTGFYDSIRWATSALIVVVPVYMLTSWLIAREFKTDPAKGETKIRKWLTYLTLFVAAVTIIADLVTLVYNYLGGDLTMQFFLKIITVLIVAVGVFGYYLWDIRRDVAKKSQTPRKTAWLVSAILLASIVLGFFIAGSPATQRARRFDETRVNDLQFLTDQIAQYWVQQKQLPGTLADLNTWSPSLTIPTDPELMSGYEYGVRSSTSFELCAEFKTATIQDNSLGRGISKPYPYGPYSTDWSHQATHTCFTRTLSQQDTAPNAYPIIK